MPPAAGQPPRVIAFANPAEGRWGVALTAPEAVLAVATPESPEGPQAPAPLPAQIEARGNGAWSLRTDGGEFSIAAAAEPIARGSSEGVGVGAGGGAGGRLWLGSGATSEVPSGKFDSLRLVAAWFPGGSAAALTAVRPSGAKGHDRDAISVVVVGEDPGTQVFDPRLSSTYHDDGTLRRVGMELWVGESEEGDVYPRRVAGEVTGAPARISGGALGLEAYPLRCHARGEEGLGVYVLVRPA